jgi:hypothetical protein
MESIPQDSFFEITDFILIRRIPKENSDQLKKQEEQTDALPQADEKER